MIGSIRGKLILKRPGLVILEAFGVGYEIQVPLSSFAGLPGEGSELFLHVHTHVREDAIKLFGFTTEEEKQIFLTLLGVNGVGPKVALNILSGISGEAFMRAVEAEDVQALSKVPGVGKKTASRIVLELKQKLPAIGLGRDVVFEDAFSALLNLGYKKSEALQALEKATKKGYNDIENLLKVSLKELTDGS
jgi:Holliday junction DNA helicase RuvA